jgi:hypothetical protein
MKNTILFGHHLQIEGARMKSSSLGMRDLPSEVISIQRRLGLC